MEKQELEKIIQEVLAEEGLALDLLTATATGQIGEVVNDLGADLYAQTIGKLLTKIDRNITMKLNSIVFWKVGLDTSFRELSSFMITGLGLNDESMIGSFGFKKTKYEELFKPSAGGTISPETKLYNDTMGKLNLTVPRLFNEAWIDEMSNPDNYDVVRIGASAAHEMDKILKDVGKQSKPRTHILEQIDAKEPTVKLIYNRATVNALGRRLSVTTIFTEEGKHFNNILNHFFGEVLDADSIKMIVKLTKLSKKKVQNDFVAAFKKLEKINLEDEITKSQLSRKEEKAKFKASKKGKPIGEDASGENDDEVEVDDADDGDSGSSPKTKAEKDKAGKEAKEKEAKEKELEDAVNEAEVVVVSKINQLLDKMDTTKRMIATAVARAILLHVSDKKNLLASAFDVSLIAGALKKSKEGSKRKLAKDTDEDSSGTDADSKEKPEEKAQE